MFFIHRDLRVSREKGSYKSVAVNHVLVSNKEVSLSIIYYLSREFLLFLLRRSKGNDEEGFHSLQKNFQKNQRCCSLFVLVLLFRPAFFHIFLYTSVSILPFFTCSFTPQPQERTCKATHSLRDTFEQS